MAPLGGTSFYIGWYREVHLKRSLSKTTELILTKLVASIFRLMGINVYAIQGSGPFWDPEWVQLGKFWVYEKYSSRNPMALMHCYLLESVTLGHGDSNLCK